MKQFSPVGTLSVSTEGVWTFVDAYDCHMFDSARFLVCAMGQGLNQTFDVMTTRALKLPRVSHVDSIDDMKLTNNMTVGMVFQIGDDPELVQITKTQVVNGIISIATDSKGNLCVRVIGSLKQDALAVIKTGGVDGMVFPDDVEVSGSERVIMVDRREDLDGFPAECSHMCFGVGDAPNITYYRMSVAPYEDNSGIHHNGEFSTTYSNGSTVSPKAVAVYSPGIEFGSARRIPGATVRSSGGVISTQPQKVMVNGDTAALDQVPNDYVNPRDFVLAVRLNGFSGPVCFSVVRILI